MLCGRSPRRDGGRAVLALAALWLGSGCCRLTLGHVELMTTRRVDPAALDTPRRQHVVGEDCLRFVGVVPRGGMPNLGRAVERALATTNGRVLTAVVVRVRWYYVPFVYGEACYMVEGDAA